MEYLKTLLVQNYTSYSIIRPEIFRTFLIVIRWQTVVKMCSDLGSNLEPPTMLHIKATNLRQIH
jgi:hypothetical protein